MRLRNAAAGQQAKQAGARWGTAAGNALAPVVDKAATEAFQEFASLPAVFCTETPRECFIDGRYVTRWEYAARTHARDRQ